VKIKALLDSNVLLAASVFVASIEDFDEPFKHDFHDHSMNLIGLLKKNMGKRIGIITKTIEDETHSVLNKVLIKTIKQFKPHMSNSNVLRLGSYILGKCEDRLESHLEILTREPILPKIRAEWLRKVEKLYNALDTLADLIDVQEIAYTKAGGSTPRYQKSAYDAILKQEQLIHKQLFRLKEKGAGPTDQAILAEAAYFFDFYSQTGDVKVYLASCDHAFSPIMGRNYESRQVTDTIHQKLNVTCHWPLNVARMIRKDLKSD
jgi:hypothetical protein